MAAVERASTGKRASSKELPPRPGSRASSKESLPPRPGSSGQRPIGCNAGQAMQRSSSTPMQGPRSTRSTNSPRPSTSGSIVARVGRQVATSGGSSFGRITSSRPPSCPPAVGTLDGSEAQANSRTPSKTIVCNYGNATVLAKLYRLPEHEVQRMMDLLEATKKEADGSLCHGEFERWLTKIFDEPNLDGGMIAGARMSALSDDGRVQLNKFLGWYVQNMFVHVASLTAEKTRSDSEILVSRVAKIHGVSATTIHDVKAQFDRYDENKNGELDFEEFTKMLYALFRAGEGDIGYTRVMRFWKEIDVDGNGVVDFEEFCVWYLKYFADGTSKGGLVEGFYDSFSPMIQRRKSLVSWGGC